MILYNIDNIRDLFGHKVRAVAWPQKGQLHGAHEWPTCSTHRKMLVAAH